MGRSSLKEALAMGNSPLVMANWNLLVLRNAAIIGLTTTECVQLAKIIIAHSRNTIGPAKAKSTLLKDHIATQLGFLTKAMRIDKIQITPELRALILDADNLAAIELIFKTARNPKTEHMILLATRNHFSDLLLLFETDPGIYDTELFVAIAKNMWPLTDYWIERFKTVFPITNRFWVGLFWGYNSYSDCDSMCRIADEINICSAPDITLESEIMRIYLKNNEHRHLLARVDHLHEDFGDLRSSAYFTVVFRHIIASDRRYGLVKDYLRAMRRRSVYFEPDFLKSLVAAKDDAIVRNILENPALVRDINPSWFEDHQFESEFKERMDPMLYQLKDQLITKTKKTFVRPIPI